MADHIPLLLYSCNTYLAYKIGQDFYNSQHFCWCAPAFSTEALAELGYATPSTSCPDQIYDIYERHVLSDDGHSLEIAANRVGITRGAMAQHSSGAITAAQRDEVIDIVTHARIGMFRPVIFVIPSMTALPYLEIVPPGERAHPLSREYRTRSLLPRSLFDVINFVRRGQ